MATLDQLPEYRRHRLTIPKSIEEMGGLHIVGTERHEARRIDNQLRGRAGRQGDRGSSRFFISLDDQLMKLFAGKTTMTALSKLGMKEGDAIEHRWVTKSVSRAQRKVEERNYEIRKNLLEYDEVMEHQRSEFYGIRQAVLEGEGIPALVIEYLAEAVADAVDEYLAPGYTKQQAAEWLRQHLDVSVDPAKLYLDDMASLQEAVRKEARSDVASVIELTLPEYMSNDLSPSEWDTKGLASWAMSRFRSCSFRRTTSASRTPTRFAASSPSPPVSRWIKRTCRGCRSSSSKNYAQLQLVEWAKQKFGIELDAEELAKQPPEDVMPLVLARAQGGIRPAGDRRTPSTSCSTWCRKARRKTRTGRWRNCSTSPTGGSTSAGTRSTSAHSKAPPFATRSLKRTTSTCTKASWRRRPSRWQRSTQASGRTWRGGCGSTGA